jgi:DNA-binding MarR family transcriptional regulator
MTTAPATATTLTPQIVGQAEKAHAPLLVRILAPTGTTMNQWVALRLTALAGPAALDQHAGRLAAALQIDDASARAAIAELAADGLLALTETDALGFTDAGRVLYEQINGAVNEVISWAYGDIPAEDLATAGRVLTEITSKLNSQSAVK